MQDLDFNEFEEVSEKTWKQKIQVDLKGKDYNATMLTTTDEGVDIKPFYHQASNEDLNIPNPEEWHITKHITDPEYKYWSNDIDAGIESFWLELDQLDAVDITSLPNVPVILQFNSGDVSKLNPRHFIFAFDPIQHLAKTGNWVTNQNEDFKNHQRYFEKTNSIALDLRLYHDAGGNCIQQLAYGLSHLAEYFKQLEFREKQSLNIIVFNAVGTHYFFEIAKIKALKVLINSLCKAEKITPVFKIVSTTGRIDYSIYDYNVNMLRSTTMAMSAVLGGSNFISVAPYDSIFKQENNFSNRIAKNQLLILKHESYFDKVENPTDGTYYINSLTKSFAEKALELFKGIETSGGFIQQLFDGKIQTKLEEQFERSLQKLESKEKVIVGVNKYPNDEDKLSEAIEKQLGTSFEKRKTLIKPIIEKRFASKLEEERLASETN